MAISAMLANKIISYSDYEQFLKDNFKDDDIDEKIENYEHLSHTTTPEGINIPIFKKTIVTRISWEGKKMYEEQHTFIPSEKYLRAMLIKMGILKLPPSTS